MNKLIVTLVLVSSLASTGAAAARPNPNVCLRLRNAIASGTRPSALPQSLVRECFGTGTGTATTTISASRPVAAVPVRRG